MIKYISYFGSVPIVFIARIDRESSLNTFNMLALAQSTETYVLVTDELARYRPAAFPTWQTHAYQTLL